MQSEAVNRRSVPLQALMLVVWGACTYFFMTTLIEWAVTLNNENRGIIVVLVLLAPIVLAGVFVVFLAAKDYIIASIPVLLCAFAYTIMMGIAVLTEF